MMLSKRATVRAMALLKNKDYTRKGLEDKLRDGYYPDTCIDYALEYVTRFDILMMSVLQRIMLILRQVISQEDRLNLS